MKYVIVKVALINEGYPLNAQFIELDTLPSFMLGKRFEEWMLLQINPETNAKQHIQWPEEFGGEVSELINSLRTAIYS